MQKLVIVIYWVSCLCVDYSARGKRGTRNVSSDSISDAGLILHDPCLDALILHTIEILVLPKRMLSTA